MTLPRKGHRFPVKKGGEPARNSPLPGTGYPGSRRSDDQVECVLSAAEVWSTGRGPRGDASSANRGLLLHVRQWSPMPSRVNRSAPQLTHRYSPERVRVKVSAPLMLRAAGRWDEGREAQRKRGSSDLAPRCASGRATRSTRSPADGRASQQTQRSRGEKPRLPPALSPEHVSRASVMPCVEKVRRRPGREVASVDLKPAD